MPPPASYLTHLLNKEKHWAPQYKERRQKSLELGKRTGRGGQCLYHIYICSGWVTKFTSNIRSEISVCIQVAFIVAGCTHATYTKAIQHSPGIDIVGMDTFLNALNLLWKVCMMACVMPPRTK